MLRLLGLVAGAAIAAASARAQEQQQVTEIFKCRGADGHWTYTNDRRDAERLKCEVVTRQVNVAPAPPMPQRAPAPVGRTTRPADFPKESPSDRASARERQREILEKELATEQTALAKAKEDLAAQEAVRS